MPCEKEFTKLIPRIYKTNAENLGLFFFIKAQLQIFPAMNIGQAINNFRRFIGITIDDWDDESMRTIYNRVEKDFYENSKTNNGNIKAERDIS